MVFGYAYDDCGNIVSETRDGLTTTYKYDKLGQLTRVNDPHENATWLYNYDRGGNILSKVKHAFTTNADPGTARIPSIWLRRYELEGQADCLQRPDHYLRRHWQPNQRRYVDVYLGRWQAAEADE